MIFLWREALWLLLAVPVLIGAYVLAQRRRKPAIRYSSLLLLRDAVTTGHRLRTYLPPLLFLLALVAVLFAISRPATIATVPSAQRTIVLAIDVSLSMGADDVEPTRLAAAQAAAKAFVRSQPRDVRVGVVAFAGHADLVQAPTTRREETIKAIDHLQLQYSTALGNGVLAALMTIFPEAEIGTEYDIFGLGRTPKTGPEAGARPLKEARMRVRPGSFESAAIVLLTDGRSSFGVGHTKAAQTAAQFGVRVYTVGFGNAAGAAKDMWGQPVDVEFDEVALKEIAQTTGGNYFHAATAEELTDVYRTLTRTIVLETKLLELTAIFTAVGALLSLASVGLSCLWSNRFV